MSRNHTSPTTRRPIEIRVTFDLLLLAQWERALQRADATAPQEVRLAHLGPRQGRPQDWRTGWRGVVLAPVLLEAYRRRTPALPLLQARYPDDREAA